MEYLDDVVDTKGFYDNKRARKVINEVPPSTNFKDSWVLKFACSLARVYKKPIHT